MGQPQLRKMLREDLEIENTYFQPPENLKMKYPCVVYQYDAVDTEFADNHPYSQTDRYQLTVIDQDPNSVIFQKIKRLSMCTFQRSFAADDLNHFVFNIYF